MSRVEVDPRYFCRRWPDHRSLAGTGSSRALEVLADSITYQPAVCPVADHDELLAYAFRFPSVLCESRPKARAVKGARITVDQWTEHELTECSPPRARISRDQTSPPDPPKWHGPTPWLRTAVTA